MEVLKPYQNRLDEISSALQKMERFSWTSKQYQRDILSFIAENRSNGFGVIEVGCYKGGLSALMSALCAEFSWPFYTMDVWDKSIESTNFVLETLGLRSHSTVHYGDLGSFVEKFRLSERPALIVLDGDHSYDAVVSDIRNTYRLSHLPHAAAFHDYSLRHPTTGERVDDAIADMFGQSAVPRLIGAQMTGDGSFPTRDNPQPDGHYWNVPGSEGAIVRLPPELPLRT